MHGLKPPGRGTFTSCFCLEMGLESLREVSVCGQTVVVQV